MLRELRLERFKKFEDLRVHFSPFTVLMGENSSGKTTILQSLNLALVCLNSFDLVAEDAKGSVKVRSKGVGLTKIPGIELSDFRELYYAKRSRASRVEKWVGSNLGIEDICGNTYNLQLTSLFGGFNIKCYSTPEDLKQNPNIHKKPPLFISGFVGLTAAEERIFPVALLDRLRSGHVSSVIRNLILDTKKNSPDRFEKLKHRLSKDFDFHLDKVFFNEDQDLYVTAQYNELCESKSLSLDFSSSGSGFMQILQILAPIYRFCPDRANIVLLDEPDAHLHPNLQTTLANSLRKIRDELDIQIIVSTHSTSIIRAASPSEVVPISAGARICRPLTDKKELEEHVRTKIDSYSLAKSVISGKLIFFEDSDLTVLEEFDDALNKKIFNGANTSPVIRGRGKTDRVPFQIKNILKEFLDEDIEIIFVRDGDGIPPKWRERLTEYASKRDVKLHILERYEIESYLLEPALFFKALSKKHPDALISTADIEQQIKKSLKDTIKLSRYHYDDSLEEEIYQAALLMNIGEYRNPQSVKSEIREWHPQIEGLSTLKDLQRYGMGKEALKSMFKWINEEKKINLSRRDLFDEITEDDIPSELSEIFDSLKSKEHRENPEGHESVATEECFDEVEEEVGNLAFGFLNTGPHAKDIA